MSNALAKREIKVERAEMHARFQNAKRALVNKTAEAIAKQRDRLDKSEDAHKTAVVVNGMARFGGMAAEAVAKKKNVSWHKYIGPAATIGGVVAVTLALTAKKKSESVALLGVAGALDGAAARFVIEHLDRIV